MDNEQQDTRATLAPGDDGLESAHGPSADAGTERLGDRLVMILEAMVEGILVVDRQGRTVMTNGAYATMFGGPDATFVPEDEHGPLPDDVHPREQARAGRTFMLEFAVDSPDGGSAGRRWFEARGQAAGADPDWAGLVVFRDISDRRVGGLQEQFLARASHELRTPLAALKASVQLLLRRLDETGGRDEPAGRLAIEALAQADGVSDLVDRLFDLSRVTVGRFDVDRRPTDLVAIVRRLVGTAAVLDAALAVELSVPRRPVLVFADGGRIEQVLVGLLTNTIVHGAASRLEVRIDTDGAHVTITMADDGRGIPLADQERLFAGFSVVGSTGRTSRAGLGLGLYLAREIVSAHDGSIDLVSEPGRGTSVTIRLPREIPRSSR